MISLHTGWTTLIFCWGVLNLITEVNKMAAKENLTGILIAYNAVCNNDVMAALVHVTIRDYAAALKRLKEI